LRYDDLLPSVSCCNDLGTAAHDDTSSPCQVGFFHALYAVDDPARRKVRGGDMLHQLRNGDIVVVDIGDDAIHHLPQVVGRHIRCHPNGDPGRAIDKKVGKLSRQYGGFLQRVVKVGLEVDRILVYVGEHLLRNPAKACLSVTHGCGLIAIDRSEITLTIHKCIPEGPVLGHTHHGVVHRLVTMRVVFTKYFPDNTRRILIGLVVIDPQLEHTVEHPAVDRLEAVTDVGKGAGNNDGHRIVDVRTPHFILYVDWDYALPARGLATGIFSHLVCCFLARLRP